MGHGSLIQRITYKVSGRTTASGGLFVPSTIQWDYAVGGIPFLSATSDNRPDREQPVQLRKQQFDNQRNPGEYSLTQWWLRSQFSYLGGAGVVYQDPDTGSSGNNTRFNKSIGIDPFSNPAQISLLKETEQATAITGTNNGNAYLSYQANQGLETVWVARGDRVETRSVAAGDLPIVSSATIPTSGSTQGISGGIASFMDTTQAISPPQFATVFMQDFSSTSNSGIWKVARGSTSATQIYQTPSNINFVTLRKSRGLIAFAAQNQLWLLDPFVTSGLPVALPAPNAAVPKDQLIVAVTEGPDGVYVAANDQTQGYIYRSTFNSTTGVVNGLTLVAEMPNGETINDIGGYINTYLVISTNQSIRVGTFTIYGITYGPQLLKSPFNTPSPGAGILGQGFGRIGFYGQLALVCTLGTAQHDGSRGLMAVNLGSLNSDQITGLTFHSYSTWNYVPGSTMSLIDIAVTQTGRPVFSVGSGVNANVYVEHATTLISQGYLDTGRCRFNTIEPKLFKYFSIRGVTPLSGNLQVSVLDDTGGITNYITYGPTLDPGVDDVATPIPGGPRNWQQLRFTLNRSPTDVTAGAIMNSWQMKALPGVLRQRMITRNFLCFNTERDKGGNEQGGDTQALDRLMSIRQMCQRGDVVTLQDLAQGISTQVIIDDYQFTMLAPPGPNRENFGGYLTVVMRTTADAVPAIPLAAPEGDT